jgi:putative transcriptional regulator
VTARYNKSILHHVEQDVNPIIPPHGIIFILCAIVPAAMKLQVRIREVAQSRGVKTAYQLQKKVKLSPSNAAKLYRNDIVQISIETLGKLCTVLNCTPNDLLVPSKTKTRG